MVATVTKEAPGKAGDGLAMLRDRLKTRRPFCAYDEVLGIRLVSVDAGRACVEVDVDARFHNPNDRLHGGLIASLADSAFGAALTTVTDRGGSGTNTDLSMRFLRAATGTRLRAEAWVVKDGARVVFVHCDVHDGDRLVAQGTSTFLRL